MGRGFGLSDDGLTDDGLTNDGLTAAMNFTLLNGIGPLLALLAVIALLTVFLCYPLRWPYPDDQGDGQTLVLLPPPKLPAHWRTPVMMFGFLLLFILYRSLHGDLNPDYLYARLLTRLAETVVRAPAQVSAYTDNFTLGLRFLVFGTILAFAVVGRGNLPRRLMVASQAFLYLFYMLFIDTALLVAEVLANVAVGPTTLLGNFVAVGVAVLAMTRMQYANYAMPKPSQVPFVRRPRVNDAATLIGVTVASLAISMAGVLALYHLADPAWRPALALLLPVPFAEGSFMLRTLFLAIINKMTVRPDPPVGDVRPPLDVIIPAYNEEEVIEDTLVAIDVAAGRYGGQVNVILMNDGSTDRTEEIARRVMDAFAHARGVVYQGRHGGKSETLNGALARTTSEIVVRIDADTIVGEWSLYYSVRWFRDPQIGLVEPMCFPRWRPSVFPHLRLFEEIKQFGMSHYTLQTVDGVNVVPGVFTAFRRSVALELGGFTVGMNGEDGDFTLRFGRLGYRSWMDPKVIVYEDVPGNYPEIREQRVRWGRAVHHNQSRHGPYRAGVATPKVWFGQTQQFFKSSFAPARLLLPLYLLLVALFEGTYRNVILVFFGAYFIAEVVFMLLQLVGTSAYRQTRHFWWVLLWPFWHEFLLVFATDAWISIPGRPLGLHGSRPPPIAHAVVH